MPPDRSCHRLPHGWKHRTGEDSGGMQDLLLGEVAEGKLADEVIGPRLFSHPSDLLADRAWRPRNSSAILHHRIKILRQPRKARLGAVLLPELHEAGVE